MTSGGVHESAAQGCRSAAYQHWIRSKPSQYSNLGDIGTFDDSGVLTSCLETDGDRRLLFYTGWSRGVTVPFYLAGGLAISEGNARFRRASRAPLLERTDVEPYLNASPFVRREAGRWRMWYVSGTGWQTQQEPSEPCYHIRYAESHDGIEWRRSSIAIDYATGEHAFGRPWVVRDRDAVPHVVPGAR